MKFDFSTYMNSFLDRDIYNDLLKRKEEVFNTLTNYEMTGWLKNSISHEEVLEIKNIAQEINEKADLFLVLGIGGSYLGSKALVSMFSKYFEKNSKTEVIYGGINMSSSYLDELMSYIEDKDIYVNVISKSGTTMEISVAFDLIYKKLLEKYDEEEVKKRIIVTTDKEQGKLRKLVEMKGYRSFVIPQNIGGRFSICTPAGLLPAAVFGINIDMFLEGYNNSKLKYFDKAYDYACIRNTLYQKGYQVENFCVYEERLTYLNEWLKQLFGESEGKDNKGLLPTSCVYTRDLHSLGQFMQSGSPIVFETVIRIEEGKIINYQNSDINKMNMIISDSVAAAHYKEHTPSNIITLEKLDSKTIGEVMYFFMLSVSFSGILLGVNPFNQEGVEEYKKEVKKNLNYDN